MLKGLIWVVGKVFSVRELGIRIGFSEHELVVDNSLPGIYGLFTLIIERGSRRLFVGDVRCVATNYNRFIGALAERSLENYTKYFLVSVLSGLFVGIALSRYRRSRECWTLFLRKLFAKREPEHQVLAQKRVLCKDCGREPADVMFLECRHLRFCRKCFGLSPKSVCDDCGCRVTRSYRINYI